MKTRLLIIIGICIIVLVFSLVYIPVYLYCPEGLQLDLSCSFPEREDLKEVVYSNTDCAKFWRVELFSMWDNQTYDYKNDSIFKECSKALDNEK